MKRDYAVNKKIREIMKENGKKQSDVADRAGIKRDVIHRIVRLKRAVYAQEVLPICNALGVSVEDLFDEAHVGVARG